MLSAKGPKCRNLLRIMPVWGLLIIGVIAQASANEVFTISGIALDEEAETAVIARETALAKGRMAAYEKLRARLTLPEDVRGQPLATPEQVLAMVLDFSVRNEKLSSVRYMADMIVRFEPEAIRAHFRALGISFSETVSKPVLIVPVLRADGFDRLWEDPNPWAEAWRELEFVNGLVPLTAPVGDLADIATLDAGAAVAGDAVALFSVADNYGAEEAAVALAEPVFGTGGLDRVDVTVTRLGRVLPPRTMVDSFDLLAGETELDLYARAAKGLSARIEADWKRDTRPNFATSQTLQARVPVIQLSDYISIRTRLSRVAMIAELEIGALTKGDVEVFLAFLGSLDQLQLALAQQDLVLLDEGGQWVIRDANAPVNPPIVSDVQSLVQPETVFIDGNTPMSQSPAVTTEPPQGRLSP